MVTWSMSISLLPALISPKQCTKVYQALLEGITEVQLLEGPNEQSSQSPPNPIIIDFKPGIFGPEIFFAIRSLINQGHRASHVLYMLGSNYHQHWNSWPKRALVMRNYHSCSSFSTKYWNPLTSQGGPQCDVLSNTKESEYCETQ